MDPITTLLLTSSVVAGIIAGLVNGYLNRRAAKKIPKTEGRAEAYSDLVAYMVTRQASSTQTTSTGSVPADLGKIKSRLALFAESEVVIAASEFLSRHAALDTDESKKEFAEVVSVMRRSLLTGHGEDVTLNIQKLF